MGFIISATHFPINTKTISPDDYPAYSILSEQMKEAATRIAHANPQTVVILSRGRVSLPDSIGINQSPYIRGNISDKNSVSIKVGFDTDKLLLNAVKKKSRLVGIPLVDIFEATPTIQQNDYLLHPSAVIPLHFLQDAGLHNKHILSLTLGRISYEELFTLGKILQSSAVESKRKIAIITAADMLPVRGVAHTQANLDLNLLAMQALGDKQFSLLAELGYPAEEEFSFRALAFLLGSISKLNAVPNVYYYETIAQCGYGLMHYDIN